MGLDPYLGEVEGFLMRHAICAGNQYGRFLWAGPLFAPGVIRGTRKTGPASCGMASPCLTQEQIAVN